MRSWESFKLSAYWAYDAIAEAEGFKSGVEKRQKQREALKKARRKDKLTAKELRQKKIDSLNSSNAWKNLR